MNIKDVVDIPVQNGDSLEMIFEKQHTLLLKYFAIEQKNGRYYPSPSTPFHELDSPTVQSFLKEEIFRIVTELVEASDCLKNKPWKQTHMETDKDHFYEEIIDAFHFFIELCIWVGITPKLLTEVYLKKATVNEFRQRSNY